MIRSLSHSDKIKTKYVVSLRLKFSAPKIAKARIGLKLFIWGINLNNEIPRIKKETKAVWKFIDIIFLSNIIVSYENKKIKIYLLIYICS